MTNEDRRTPAGQSPRPGLLASEQRADLSESRAPAAAPCFSCPYRRDVPSGIWHADEYRKLPPYDGETFDQPTGVFHCHQQDGRVCAGWAGTHGARAADRHEFALLALRLAPRLGMPPDVIGATAGYVSPVPLFESGREACAHGLAEISKQSPEAARIVTRIARKRSRNPTEGDTHAQPT